MNILEPRSAATIDLYSLPFLFVACGSGLGLFGKLPLIYSLLHIPIPVLGLGCAVFVCLPAGFVYAIRSKRLMFSILIVGVLAADLYVFPHVEALHSIGHGSDQADCVIVASERMQKAQWPYDAHFMWSHNAMSCGPGWVLLELPFLSVTSYGVTQLLLFLICFTVIWRAAGAEFTLAYGSLLVLCPGVWLCIANGSDLFPFGLIAATVCITAKRFPVRGIRGVPLCVFMGLLFQFRTPFVVIPGLFSKRLGVSRAALVGLFAIAMEMCFFFWNPAVFIQSGPMHLLAKSIGKNVFQANLNVLGVLISVCLCLGLVLMLLVGKYYESDKSLMIYLAAWLGVPAAIDLFRKLTIFPVVTALGAWEGGPWLAGIVPIAALYLLSRRKFAEGAWKPMRNEV